MEIHKPKPWHGVREFLKEYAIIVVGVLTALGAEQGVEWLHWRHMAERAEQDLAAGLQPDLLNAVAWIGAKPCFRLWLTPLATELRTPDPNWRAALLTTPAAHRDTRLVRRVFAVPAFVWSHAAWETAEASGVLNHMPRDRVQRYSEVYRLVDLVRGGVTTGTDLADDLTPLGVDRRLTEAEKGAYLQRLARLERTVEGEDTLSRQILKDAHALGVDPPADQVRQRLADGPRVYGACIADVKLPLS